ncbi:hypothetical protein H0H87_010017 [Tephrocybe sp. NHM501043]|nr:hypothetical protein H0H87_010017 [Tephrocybe sp. NHM501043]
MSSVVDTPDSAASSSPPTLEQLLFRQLEILQRLQSGVETQDISKAKSQRDLIEAKFDALRNEVHPVLVAQRDALMKMNNRQEESDTALRPFPPVSTSTPSVWASLSTSAQSTMNPEMERLRSSLDALLVFLGLFSAIIAAFFIESSKGCKEDQAKRTNELLQNLTNIFLDIHNASFGDMQLPEQKEFAPDPRDMRATSYWAIALIFGLSIAALAVVCRGFLSSLIQQQRDHSLHALALTWSRWKEAHRLLEPTVQFIPFLMTIPVLVFIAGFLDFLFSLRDDINGPIPVFIVTTFSITTFLIIMSLAFVLFSTLHGARDPLHSPFQSWLSKGGVKTQEHNTFSSDEMHALCELVEQTYEEEPLEKASSTLAALLSSAPGTMYPNEMHSTGILPGFFIKVDQEGNQVQLDRTFQLIRYLISPDTTLRTGITVASAVAQLPAERYRYLFCSYGRREAASLKFIDQLLDLATRAAQMYGIQTLHNSEIIISLDAALRTHFEVENVPGVALRNFSSSNAKWAASITLYWLTIFIETAFKNKASWAASSEILPRIRRLVFDSLKAKAMSVVSVLGHNDDDEGIPGPRQVNPTEASDLSRVNRFESWDAVIDPEPLRVTHLTQPASHAVILRLFPSFLEPMTFARDVDTETDRRGIFLDECIMWAEAAFRLRYFAVLCRKAFSTTKFSIEEQEIRIAHALRVLDDELQASKCRSAPLKREQRMLLWMFIVVKETFGKWVYHPDAWVVQLRFEKWLEANKKILLSD